MMRALTGVFDVRVRHVLSEAEAQRVLTQAKGKWIELTVRDVIEGAAPFRLRLYEDPKSKRVYAQQPGDQVVFVADSALLALRHVRCGSPTESAADAG